MELGTICAHDGVERPLKWWFRSARCDSTTSNKADYL